MLVSDQQHVINVCWHEQLYECCADIMMIHNNTMTNCHSGHFREKLIDQDRVMLSSTFKTSTHLIGLLMDFYLHHLFFIQFEGLQFVRDQLWFSALSSEVQPLPSDTSGPESQHQAAGFRSEAAVWFSGESTLQTGDSEVRHHFYSCAEMNMMWKLCWH